MSENSAGRAGSTGTVAVVLAGGTARRLGGVDKTALPVGGRSVLVRLVDDLAAWPTVVVGPARDVGRPVLWAREDPPGGGPFAAVAAGVVVATAAHPGAATVLVLAGDQPFAGPVAPRLLAALASGTTADAALACGPDGRPQPLLAAYRLAAVVDRLADAPHGRAARDLVAGLRAVHVPATAGAVLDVDDPDDLAAARRAAADVSRPPGVR